MAIVDDIKRDRRTKNVLAQTNTKTVSAPLSTTGLTGDQLPAEIFTVSDFETVKNQVHLEENNFQLMEALNVMGQITNMQSQSGPIPNTGQITSATITGSGSANMQKPITAKNGEVWDVLGASGTWNTSPGASVTFGFYAVNDLTDVTVLLGTTSSTSTGPGFDVNEFLSKPFYLTYPFSLGVTVSTLGSAANCEVFVYSVRVR